jgi:ATP synthase protein I
MNTMTQWDAGQQDDDIVALTAEQARQWRKTHPVLSPWWVIGAQAVAGLLLAGVLLLLTGSARVAWSAGYGALAVLMPAAVLARAMRGRSVPGNAAASAAGALLWEVVKIALTVAMLMAAPRLVREVSWPALLAGMFLAVMMYWAALAVKPGQRLRAKTDRMG